MRRLYYRMPASMQEPLHKAVLRSVSRFSLWSSLSVTAPATISVIDRSAGFNLIGYFRGEFSIGECARAFAAAAREHGLPTALLNFEAGVA